MASELVIEVLPIEDTCVVVLHGDLDPTTASRLEAELGTAVFTTDCRSLVLDLEEVNFIDSAGLSVILKAFKLMRERDGSLVIRRPSLIVQRLFEITSLTGELVIE